MSDLLKEIKEAKAELDNAKMIKCTCSSFVIQYDGCGCERSKRMLESQNKLNRLLEKLNE